jgi:membrane-bound lytic murein transglycosylase F
MPIKLFFRVKKRIFISFSLFLVMACNPFIQTSSLEKIQKRGDIIMGTINSSLTYSYDGNSYSGLDYELGKQFAIYLDVKLTIKEYSSLTELFFALDNNEVDFVGSGLTLTPKRAKKYRSSPPYYYVSQKLVYHKGTYRPRKIADVNAPISVLANSSHAETLVALIEENPLLKIESLDNQDQETLLRKVADKEVKFAIVDSTTLAQKQRYYPVLAEAFTISEKQPVAWLINKNQDDSVYAGMIEFIGNKYNDQTIAQLEEKYFGHVGHFDYVDTRIFLKRIKKTLPKYEVLFKKYGNDEVNWQLLAAVSYQESHWNPKARSPTGVRGMMMLTLDTADYVGIKNRLDPEQSIKGGAKYLSQLIKRLPDSINDDERRWFALASYNIGYGHLMDARRITVMKKQNPDSWSDVKDNLPLLHQRKWYKQTRYGYARGREAQHYVNNIRQYLETLNWYVFEQEKALKIELEKQAEIDRLATIEAAKLAEIEAVKQDEIDRLAAIEAAKQAEIDRLAAIEVAKLAEIKAEKQAVIEAAKQAEIDRLAAIEAAKQAKIEAAKQAKIEAAKQAKIEAAKQAKIEVAKQAKIEAAKQAKIEVAKQAKIEVAKQAKIEAAKQAKIEVAKQAKIEAAKQAKIEAAKQAENEASKALKTSQD